MCKFKIKYGSNKYFIINEEGIVVSERVDAYDSMALDRLFTKLYRMNGQQRRVL